MSICEIEELLSFFVVRPSLLKYICLAPAGGTNTKDGVFPMFYSFSTIPPYCTAPRCLL